jgi:phenylacetate-CoA ligase
MIEKELNIPVFSSYQTVEAFGIAFECEYHQGMHLNIDLYPVRIVDAEGVTLQPGDSGEVVVSNLVNRATVLLNYRLGDVAAVLPGRCACGRSLPLLSFLHGRSEDWIELASGRLVHPQSLHMIMEDEEKIWQYQVIQETSRNFVIRVIAAEDCDLGRTREQIATEFVRALGDDVTIDVSFVDSIDRTEGGKFRPILSLRSRLRDGPAHYK